MRDRLYTRRFWHLFLAHFLAATATLSLPVLALWVREDLEARDATVGLFVSTAVLAGILVRPAYGYLLDHVGRRAGFVAGGLLTSLAFFFYPSCGEVGGALFVLRFLHGLGIGGLIGTFFTYATDVVPRSRRVEGIAVFGVSGLAAHGIGPVLGEAISRASGYPAYFAAMGTLAAAGLVVALDLPETRPAGGAPARGGLRYAFAHRPVAVLWPASILYGAVFAASAAFAGVLVASRGLPSLSPFFLSYAGAAIAIRLAGSRVLDAIGAARAIVPASAPLAVGMAIVAAATEPWHLVAGGLAGGAGHGILFPALGALMVERSDPARRGTIVSLFTGSLELGGLIGSPLCGVLAETWGFGPVYVALAGATCVGAAYFAMSRAAAG